MARVRAGEFVEPLAEERSASRGGLFPIITAVAALAVGYGYAGRAYVGERGRLSTTQRLGLTLVSLLILSLLAVAVLARLYG